MRPAVDEAAFNLEEATGQVLEVSEGGHAGPKVVQREEASKRLQFTKKPRRLVEIGDRRRFREFEAYGPGAHDITPELLANEFEEALIPDRRARNIDGIGSAGSALGTQGIDLGERVLNEPLVDQGHHVVAFSGRNERHRGNDLVVLVEHAHEQLVMVFPGGLISDRVDFLGMKHETPFLERSLQPRHPFHLAPAQKHLAVVRTIELNAIASLLLRHIAGGIGRPEYIGEGEHSIGDMDYANARADGERSAFADKAKVGYALLQLIGDANRLMHRAILEQYAEFIAAQTGKRISFTHLLLQQRAHLSQELIAGCVSAGIVDDFELIEIQVHHHVLSPLVGGRVEGQFEAVFKLGAVDQVGQLIVARMVGELHCVFLPQLELLELALRAIDAADHALRKENPERDQSSRDRHDHEKQRGLDPACGLTQCVREPVLPRPELFVDLDNAVQYESESGWVHATGQVERVELFGGRVKSREEIVPGLPYIEHALHVAHALKTFIKADDGGSVIRVGPAFQEAGPDGGIVRSRFFKLEPGTLETQGHHDRLPIAEEIGLGFGLGETQQVEHRFLLVLRPQALAFNVRAARSENVDADNGKPDQHGDDRQERGNDQEHALAHCKPLSDFCDRSHKGLDVNEGHDSLHVLPFFPRNV